MPSMFTSTVMFETTHSLFEEEEKKLDDLLNEDNQKGDNNGNTHRRQKIIAKIQNNKKRIAALIFCMLLAIAVPIFYVICSDRRCYLAATPAPIPASAFGPPTNLTLIATTNSVAIADSTTFITTSIFTSATSSEAWPTAFLVTLIVMCVSAVVWLSVCIKINVAKRQKKLANPLAATASTDSDQAIVDADDSLYWIYDKKLSGPFNKEKICDMYRTHELYGTLTVQNTKSPGRHERHWFKIYLPPLYPHDLTDLLTKQVKNLDDEMLQNIDGKKKFKQSFPNLFDALRKVKMQYPSCIRIPILPTKTVVEQYGISDRILRVCAIIIGVPLLFCWMAMLFLSLVAGQCWLMIHPESLTRYFVTIPNHFLNFGADQYINGITALDKK
eukprot:735661_1